MDPISSRQLEGVVNTMNDAFRLVVTACERSRDCAADVSRARDGGRGAQSLDAEGTLLDVLAVAKQKAKGLESTAESALRQLSVRLGQSEETLSEKDRGQLMSEVSPLGRVDGWALVTRTPVWWPFEVSSEVLRLWRCCLACSSLELLKLV